MNWRSRVNFNSKSQLISGFQLLVCLLILKVTFNIVQGYSGYWPPDFTAEFLRGRKAYFFGSYRWAFYPHIAAGPVTLVLGMVLLSDRFRQGCPHWHSRLGKLQIAVILLLVVPSGLWMSFYAQAGVIVKVGFALLALATGLCAAAGWLLAVRRQFGKHRIWMWRTYVLLCSAVVTRLMGGMFVIAGIDAEWTYYLAAWVSWLVPLGVFEWIHQRGVPKPRRSSL